MKALLLTIQKLCPMQMSGGQTNGQTGQKLYALDLTMRGYKNILIGWGGWGWGGGVWSKPGYINVTRSIPTHTQKQNIFLINRLYILHCFWKISWIKDNTICERQLICGTFVRFHCLEKKNSDEN